MKRILVRLLIVAAYVAAAWLVAWLAAYGYEQRLAAHESNGFLCDTPSNPSTDCLAFHALKREVGFWRQENLWMMPAATAFLADLSWTICSFLRQEKRARAGPETAEIPPET